MPAILGFGAVAIDDLLYVDEYPPADSKVRVAMRARQCGGLTGTALVAAARLGAHCGYVGLLGDDELSAAVRENFAREGIDVTHSPRRSDARPGNSVIIVDRQARTRTIFSHLGGRMGADPELPDESVIRAARVLLVDHHGLEGTLRAVRIARAGGIGVVADFERDPGPPFLEILDQVDHLILSERFARLFTREPSASAAARALWHPRREAVVVTCGSVGCWCASASGTPVHYPAPMVDAVDTTGCGDVFHGAYAAALAEGMDLARRLQFASATAAIKATQFGAQAGIPSREAVMQFLASSTWDASSAN